jgi:acyl-CoA synthetase (AMP-forming)/AMP-acid ligase II
VARPDLTLWDFLGELAKGGEQNVLFSNVAIGTEESYSDVLEQVTTLVSWLSSMGSHRLVANLPNSTLVAKLVLACLISGREICCLADGSTSNETLKAISVLSPDLVILAPSSLGSQSVTELEGVRWVYADELTEELEEAPHLVEKINSTYSGFSYGNLIVYTSGSTGEPKGLLLHGERLWKSARVFADLNQLNQQNRFWNYLPMSYLGGLFNLLLIPIAAGSSIFVDSTFGPKTFLQYFTTLEREGIDSVWLVPTIARGLTRLGRTRKSSRANEPRVRNVFLGTAPSTEKERAEVGELFGCHVLESYGLTETTFITCQTPPSISGREPLTVIYPGVETRISPDDSTLEVRSPYAFVGSFLGPSVFLPNNLDWINTGDVCIVENGIVRPIARVREIIKKGGLLVNLPEIEVLAREQVEWGEVVTLPFEDDFYGENYILVFESRGKISDRINLIGYLATYLSRSKLPKDVIEVSEIPTLRSGKPDKKKLSLSLQKDGLEFGKEN